MIVPGELDFVAWWTRNKQKTVCLTACVSDGREAQAVCTRELHVGMSVAHFFVEGGLGNRQRIRQNRVVVLGTLQ